MPAIMDIARRHNLKVIEDCAQAHGARIDDRLVGTFSDAGSFSFCQDKILSTGGEGGMLLTDSEELWKSAWSFKDHGKNWDKVSAPAHSPGFRWLHDSFGSNYRLTEMQAAIGRIQLRRLGDWIEKRRVNAQQLIEGLSGLPALRIPVPERNVTHAYYKFYAFVVRERLRSGWDRDRILDALQAEGAPGWSGSCPEIYREKAFDTVAHNSLPVARELGRTSIMLPVHPTLSGDDMAWLIDVLRRVMNKATRKF
jgi:dTDP-4-amino-4,6-dideoxygalactose transaminase